MVPVGFRSSCSPRPCCLDDDVILLQGSHPPQKGLKNRGVIYCFFTPWASMLGVIALLEAEAHRGQNDNTLARSCNFFFHHYLTSCSIPGFNISFFFVGFSIVYGFVHPWKTVRWEVLPYFCLQIVSQTRPILSRRIVIFFVFRHSVVR